MADERLAHPRAEAVLRRHLLPAVVPLGRPGFAEILAEIAKRWRESRAELAASADGVIERLREVQQSRRPAGGRMPDGDLLAGGVREYAGAFDARNGGFGGAPKFPRPAELLFLLREHARTGDVEARHMVLETLRAMALGGMRDHVGGGFHRYSVDAMWRVPHFEKMLYDQAQLVIAFLETAQAAGEPSFADVAHDTLAYVHRDLRHAGGGFFSAEDADSLPPDGGVGGGAGRPRSGAARAFRRRRTAPGGRRRRRKGRSTSGASRRSRRCSGTTPTSSGSATGSSRTATPPRTRTASSLGRTCSTWRAGSTTSRG